MKGIRESERERERGEIEQRQTERGTYKYVEVNLLDLEEKGTSSNQ